MSAAEILAQLESLGTEQNRKIYRKHGIKETMFGVSHADLKKIAKKIKINHDLAQELWTGGNHDARALATLIADPKQTNTLDFWIHDLHNYVITDAFSGYAGKTPLAREKMEQWIPSSEEYIATVGWNLLAGLALNDSSLSDDYFEKYLQIIENTLHSSKNRVRYAMNNALIAIGMRNANLEQKAVAVAKHIGKVEVDHGDTSCKTPDAIDYIEKAKARKKT